MPHPEIHQRHDIYPWTLGACNRIELIVVRCRPTEGGRSCDTLRGTASTLAHGARLDDGPGRFAVNHQMSHKARVRPDSAPLPQCSLQTDVSVGAFAPRIGTWSWPGDSRAGLLPTLRLLTQSHSHTSAPLHFGPRHGSRTPVAPGDLPRLTRSLSGPTRLTEIHCPTMYLVAIRKQNCCAATHSRRNAANRSAADRRRGRVAKPTTRVPALGERVENLVLAHRRQDRHHPSRPTNRAPRTPSPLCVNWSRALAEFDLTGESTDQSVFARLTWRFDQVVHQWRFFSSPGGDPIKPRPGNLPELADTDHPDGLPSPISHNASGGRSLPADRRRLQRLRRAWSSGWRSRGPG